MNRERRGIESIPYRDVPAVSTRGRAPATTSRPPSPGGLYLEEQIEALAGWCCAFQSISSMAGKGLIGPFASLREVVRSLEPFLEQQNAPELMETARRIQAANAEEIPELLPALVQGLRKVIDDVRREPVSILVLNGGAGRAEEIEEMLEGPRREIRIAFSVPEAEQAMESAAPDLLVVRLEPYDAESRTFLISLLSRPESVATPTIVLISDSNPTLRAECFALGADAVLVMPGDAEICSTAVAATLRRRAAIERVAQEDHLTGLSNRAAFARIFRRLQSLAQRNQEPLTLAILDLDCFKKVNDRLGHAAGDLLLQSLARVVESTLRSSDVLARWGGDEFVVIFPRTEAAGAEEALDKARRSFRDLKPRQLGGAAQSLEPSFSAGITYVRHEDSVESAVARADRLLYQAKEVGRNQVISEKSQDNLALVLKE